MQRSSNSTRQVLWYLIALGLFCVGVLAAAFYRGRVAVQINDDVDNVTELRVNALMAYIAEQTPARASPNDQLLTQMRLRIAQLQRRYPEKSAELIHVSKKFYQEANQYQISLETTQDLVNVTRQFSLIIKARAKAEAANGYWMLVYGILGLLLLLIRGFILVQQLHRTENALKRSERRFAMLAEATFEGIILSEDGIVKDANLQFAKLMGYSLPETIGRHLSDFVHPDYAEKVRESVENHCEETYEVVCVRKDHSTFPLEVTSRVLQVGKSHARLTVGRDITQRKQSEQNWQEANRHLAVSNQRWKSLATLDSLTGAYTRRVFQKMMSRAIRRAGHSGLAFSVMMLDLDEFKEYNDSFGHVAGDEVLCHIVTLLHDTLREMDIVARYGGEEFAIILVDTAALEAKAVAERCRQKLAETSWFKSQVTASFGVLTCSIKEGTFVSWGMCKEISEEILVRTDVALYQSKEKGRNCVTVADSYYATKSTFGGESHPNDVKEREAEEDEVSAVAAGF